MSRLVLYYRHESERDRWFPGDRFIRPAVRRLVRGRQRAGGIDKVFANLCLGLDRLGVQFDTNLAFDSLEPSDRVAVLGRGRFSLEGYNRSNRIVAGIGLMTHPSEWPTLCEDYPVARYLQHSEWANEIYKPYFGNRCEIWPVGIDTTAWAPRETVKDVDVLIYDKIQWERPVRETTLLGPIRNALRRRGLEVAEIRYGNYDECEFHDKLSRSRSMLFLTEHESQGLAYQECLSSGVPVLAWEQGQWLDPNRFRWGTPEAQASSVPYFDDRCGLKFGNYEEFEAIIDRFLARLPGGTFDPRGYVLENLTLELCSQRFLEIVEGANHP